MPSCRLFFLHSTNVLIYRLHAPHRQSNLIKRIGQRAEIESRLCCASVLATKLGVPRPIGLPALFLKQLTGNEIPVRPYTLPLFLKHTSCWENCTFSFSSTVQFVSPVLLHCLCSINRTQNGDQCFLEVEEERHVPFAWSLQIVL